MKRKTTKEFIEQARAVHGNKYDYSLVKYINNRTKVKIVCPEHGEFEQRPDAHTLLKQGCPMCSGNKNKTTKQFIKEAKKVHNNKYDYSLVNYTNALDKITIICPEHGVFKQSAHSHLCGTGCPKCKQNYKYTKNTFIEKAQAVHGNKYDYSKVEYVNCKTKVKIVCPIHGEFEQLPDAHINKNEGCPKCGEITRARSAASSSRCEDILCTKLLVLFDENDIERQYNQDKRYPFFCDFYIKPLDLFREYNGFWTHGNHWYNKNNIEDNDLINFWISKSNENKQYKKAIIDFTERDVLKRQTAAKNNLNYVVLWNENDIEQWFGDECPVRQDWK